MFLDFEDREHGVMRRLHNATALEDKKHKGFSLQEERYDLVNIHLPGQRRRVY
jgi:hypothetical protein